MGRVQPVRRRLRLGSVVGGVVVFGSRGRPGHSELGAIFAAFTMSPAVGSEEDHSGAVDTDEHTWDIGRRHIRLRSTRSVRSG